MAVIRLQLEVDSEVQPELHELLSGIGSTASREERLRQLASTGLVWERLRIEHQQWRPGPASAGSAAPHSPLEPEAYDTFLRELREAVRELPVLTEVLETDGAGTSPSQAAAPSPALPPPAPAPRSRLQRMKEKGLFRNE